MRALKFGVGYIALHKQGMPVLGHPYCILVDFKLFCLIIFCHKSYSYKGCIVNIDNLKKGVYSLAGVMLNELKLLN